MGMDVWAKFLLLAVATLTLFYGGVVSSEIENRLHSELFRTYNKYVRPVQNHSESVLIQFGLSINQLLDVNEKDQSISTHVWLNQIWRDYRLTWNPRDNQGIDYVIVPSTWLWYPDMVNDNSVHGTPDLPVSKFATILHNGTVWITPPATLDSQCDMDVAYFPFDQQTCMLSFGPWEYTSERVHLEPMDKYVVREKFVDNVEWELSETSVRTVDEELECCPGEVYSVVIYTLLLRRRPLYYLVNVIFPCFLFSVITSLVFCVPPDFHEKITLSVSALLALSLLSLTVAEVVPPTSETTPLICRYLAFNMMMVTVSLILTVVVLNIHRGPYRSRPVPLSVRRKLLYTLPRILCMQEYEGIRRIRKIPRFRNSYTSYGYRIARENSYHQRPKKDKPDGGIESGNDLSNSRPNASPDKTSLNKSGSQNEITILDDTTPIIGSNDERRENKYWSEFEKCITSNLRFIADKIKDKDKEIELKSEWKYAARVIDRLFLVIFIMGDMAGIGTIILTAPGVFTV
ncbi:acetylcholine receptor subunit alpha-like [Ptychodera flava]|uniref:acetylcholine receptor subunit alpha-like n=1 Tax=Ptychodera flava TaxID=63121 RepID=UPI003969D8D7